MYIARVACACSYLAGLGLAVLVKRIFANAPRPLPPLASTGAEVAPKGKENENEKEKEKLNEASKSGSKEQQAPADAANNNVVMSKVSVVPPSGVIGLGIDGSLFRYHPRLCATLID